MNLQLTSQEKTLLQDQLKHEAICIQKYQKYAAEAMDPGLQQLFNSLAAQEQQHFATIQQMLNGEAPSLSQGQGQGGGQQQAQQGQGSRQQQAQQGQGSQQQQSRQSRQHQSQKSQGGQQHAQGGNPNAAERSAENYLGHNLEIEQSSYADLAGEDVALAQGNAALPQGDAALCTDSVMTEKFVSGSYDTGVFQSSNQQVIQALQHIQKEEQEHGQQLKQFMESQGLQ